VSVPGVPAGRALEVPAFPGISLAGIVRPRVLIGRPAREALTDAELLVAIAHELAHSRAWDNAKRCAMFCVADLFGGTRASRDLEAAWRAEAERLADEAAVNGDPVRAAVLASALVKVARLAPPQRPVPHSPAWSTFHEPGLLESRVRRLLAPGKAGGGRRRTARAVPVAFAAAIAAAWALGLPARLHGVTELLVTVLP
jgi:beta-lactamase regulating signal transducer with metallopeptidase domain